MSRNSPSARKHRAFRFLAHLEQYKRLGPLVGPKEPHQPDHRWPIATTDLTASAPDQAADVVGTS